MDLRKAAAAKILKESNNDNKLKAEAAVLKNDRLAKILKRVNASKKEEERARRNRYMDDDDSRDGYDGYSKNKDGNKKDAGNGWGSDRSRGGAKRQLCRSQLPRCFNRRLPK